MFINHRSLRALVVLIVSACIMFSAIYRIVAPDTAYAAGDNSATNSSLDSMVSIPFTEDTSTVLANPERGWYRAYTTDDMWDVDSIRAQGITNVLIKADLSSFKTTPISAAKLQEIRNAFNTARKYGLNIIFRAAYDFDGVSKPEPTHLSIITSHIAQLKPIFYENEDILFCVQAGFLGPWGEWHTSYYGNPPSLSARTTIVSALMDAVPKSRQIEVRRPMFIRDMFPNQALTPSTAFNQSNLARTGYHDDALLSSEDENGTYVDPSYNRQAELYWADNQDKYTPFVAESDELSSYSDSNNAVFELNKLHAQILDAVYLPDVLNKWKNATYQGSNTYNYISQHLGYRFVLSTASVNTGLAQGGALHLVLNFQNTGFANLINARDFQIVLSNGTQTYTATVNDDARFWTKDKGMMTKDLYFSIPSNIGLGTWSIYVNMPNLSNNPLYSIRFANMNTWVASKGYNLIYTTSINSTLPNSVTSFKQISRADAEVLNTAPSSISTLALSYNSIKICWGAVNGATKYQLYRATSSTGTYSLIATTASTTYTNSSVATGTTYYYKVRAYRLAGTTKVYSPYSDIASAKAALATPSSVQAIPISYNNIKITWGSVAGRTKYELWRSTSISGPYSRLKTTSYTYYTNTGVNTGTPYYYKVRAYRLVSGRMVYSDYSEVVTTQTVMT
jgi:hypothetical protein